MTSQLRNTLLVSVLALGLGLYVYFIEIKKGEKDEKVKAASEKILDFDKEQVRRFTLTSVKGTVTLERDPQGQWNLIVPLEDKASALDVSSFLSSIESQKFDEVVGDKKELTLKTYGLDNPQAKLELYFNTGQTKSILFGNEGGLAGKMYVTVADDPRVLFASSGVKFQLEKGPKDFREKKIIRFSKEDISEFKITGKKIGASKAVWLTRMDNGWHLQGANSERADQDIVSSFLSQLESLSVSEFLTTEKDKKPDVKKYKLEEPEVQIQFVGKEKKVLGTLMGSAKAKTGGYVMWKDGRDIYDVFNNFADQFGKSIDDFRDKKMMFKFTKSDVQDLEVKTELSQVHLVKKNDKWSIADGNSTREVNEAQVELLLQKLTDLKAKEIFEIPASRWGKSKGSVSLKNAKGESVLNLEWADKAGTTGIFTVKVGTYPRQLGVETSLINSLPVQTLTNEKVENKKP